MASSAEEVAELFLSKQKRLGRKVSNTRNSSGLYNGTTPISSLKTLLEEAEEQFERFPEADNGRPTQEYLQVAIARRISGVPGECPSETKVLAFRNLKMARLSLAEAYEAKDSYEKALPLYLQLVDQAQEMRSEVWEPNDQKLHMMNNVGLCYKRQQKYDEALRWYRQALDLCNSEGLVGSGIHSGIQANLNMMEALNAGAINRDSNTSVRACWNCKSREMQKEDGTFTRKLLNCTKCVELKLASPACYCSKECQVSDWQNRHRQFHKECKQQEKTRKKENFSYLSNEAKAILEQHSSGDTFGEFDTFMIKAAKALDDNDFESSVKYLKKAIKLQPNDCAPAHHNLGIVYYRCRDYTGSIKHYSKCMELTENTSDAAMKQYWARSACTIFGMMKRQSECAVMEKPDWMTNPGSLKHVACQVVKIVPDYTEAWFMKGFVHQKANQRREAMQCYGKAAQLSETSVARNAFLQWKEDVLKNSRS